MHLYCARPALIIGLYQFYIKNVLSSHIQLPSLLSKALVLYRVGATCAPDQECNSTSNSVNFALRSLLISQKEAILPPLLEHTSPPEAHFYPLSHARPLLLHTHTSAPVHVASAQAARPQPYHIHLTRLQSRISAPTRGLVGFSSSRWSSVLDCGAWVGSGCRSMDVI